MGNPTVVRSITSVTCVMVLVKALGMLRNILQARQFGAGADVDAFTLANNYALSLFITVCYALCIAAVPIFSKKLLESRQACYRTADGLITSTVVLALGAAGLLALLGATGWAGRLLGAGDEADLFRFCFLVMLPALPIIALTYLLLALFQSMGHFQLQASLSLLYNLVLCAVLLAGDGLALKPFVVLTSVGWLLQLAMILPCMRREGYRPRLRLALGQRETWAFLRTGVTTMYNASLFLLCYLINTRFAAGAAAGTLTSFFYADKVYEPLTATLIYSVSIVMFPQFSQKYVQMSPGAYRQYVVQVLKNALLLLLPLSLLFWAFGTPVVRVLFQGGGFTEEDALLCGGVFSAYVLGMAGSFILDLLNKAYYAMGKTLVPCVLSTLVLLLCGGADLLCARLAPDQPQLLALGISLPLVVVGAAAYVGFARAGQVPFPAGDLLQGLLLSLLVGIGARMGYVFLFAGTASKLRLLLQCGGLGAAGLAVYLLLMGSRVPIREIARKLWRGKRT